MPQLIYIDLNDGRASTSSSVFSAPVLYGVQGSPVTYDFAFHDAGVVRDLALGDMPKLIMQLASATGGTTPRVIGSIGTASGSGTGSRYRCSLVADNAAVRADFAAEAASLVYELQLNWSESSDAATRRTQGIALNLDVARDLPNTETPDPVSELDDPDLYVSNRAVCYDRAQTLSNGEKQQALDNLGLNDSLSYRPGVIAVNSTQVPGVRTEPTLQAALDIVAATPSAYHTIEIVDESSQSASSSSIDQPNLCVKGPATTSIGTLDLTGSSLTYLTLRDCEISELKISPAGDTGAGIPPGIGWIKLSNVKIIDFYAPTTSDYQQLITLDGFATINYSYTNGASAPAEAAEGTVASPGLPGTRITLYGSVELRGSVAGGAGADNTADNGNGGDGGLPGDVNIGSRCMVTLINGGNLGGIGGAAGTISGSSGTDHSGDTATITSASFSGFVQE